MKKHFRQVGANVGGAKKLVKSLIISEGFSILKEFAVERCINELQLFIRRNHIKTLLSSYFKVFTKLHESKQKRLRK